LQGEGQEFESPRLHHSRGTAPAQGRTRQELKSSGPIPEATLGYTQKRPQRRFEGWSSSRRRVSGPQGHRAPDPCPSRLGRSPTSGSLGSPPVRRRREAFGPHLTNWICSAVNRRSSISPSQGSSRSRSCTLAAWSDAGGGQATKGTRWMPWRQEPMKDVAGCVKPRGVASRP
jgi:hypothetical protein